MRKIRILVAEFIKNMAFILALLIEPRTPTERFESLEGQVEAIKGRIEKQKELVKHYSKPKTN